MQSFHENSRFQHFSDYIGAYKYYINISWKKKAKRENLDEVLLIVTLTFNCLQILESVRIFSQ